MKVRDVLKRLRADGWYLKRTKGDHRQLGNPSKPGTVTVAGHLADEVPVGTLKSIFRQAGWTKENKG
jgi:predicted RNA binding protein YcfA (HicA-like mRNA interferase family)